MTGLGLPFWTTGQADRDQLRVGYVSFVIGASDARPIREKEKRYGTAGRASVDR